MILIKRFLLSASMAMLGLCSTVSVAQAMDGRRPLPQTDWSEIAKVVQSMAENQAFRPTIDSQFVTVADLQKMNNGICVSIRKYGPLVFDPPLSEDQIALFPFSAMLMRKCLSPESTIWTLGSSLGNIDVSSNVKKK